MTTTIQFSPTPNSNFQFPVTLDGKVYNVVINWNLFGARYYVNIYDLSNNLIVCRPLIGSPLGYTLSSVTYNGSFATATTSRPHNYTVGTVVELVISGCIPSDFNGTYLCNIVSKTEFTYPLNTTNQNASTPGNVVYNLSMTSGYFTSTLTYFPDNQQIIVTP